MTNEYYTPTKDERAKIERAGLAAAWHELCALEDDQIPMKTKIFSCLMAFSAASAAIENGKNNLHREHNGAAGISCYPNVETIVFSAFMGITCEFDLAETNPNAIMSDRILAMVQAVKALEALSVIHSIQDESIDGTSLADKAIEALQSNNEW